MKNKSLSKKFDLTCSMVVLSDHFFLSALKSSSWLASAEGL